ncbi:MOSC domain-containing protein [Mucilaginibacter daejeonensis]|uniref:MOSC N-terminal beta barrel domain-containing protein n=1 Tax=Mucilaginibacter daejeonensis TaxID=398049 RepID=UPI001D172623|nr:MOSC domain-containing protein [Mucilaginibacter daejeonensis]UEG55199.1 MOSC domain-containing protein [Mucilaginibacter daejeonensis]
MNITVSQIYIYPVKSLGAIALQEAELTSRGLKYDRRWMLIDEEHRFLSQRKYPQMALFHLSVTDIGILVKHSPTNDSIIIPFEPLDDERVEVQVWDDTCIGTYVSTLLDDWFTNRLDLKCRLIYVRWQFKVCR